MKRFSYSFPGRGHKCRVFCGNGIVESVLDKRLLARYTRTLAVVDSRVMSLYGNGSLGKALKGIDIYSFPSGERHKDISNLNRILTWLHEQKADRHSLLLGIGGGVVTDIAGFAASCYMRGIDYISVPTTLLAQVDAAIGGKTAVNLSRTKNIVGSFYPARIVICDESFLSTLRVSSLKDGLVEALKVFLAMDSSALDRHQRTLSGSGGQLNALISDAIRLKVDVVSRDPFEKRLRQVLNFGHTTGHAFEALTGYSHGKSVALGMLVALQISRRHFGLMSEEYDRAWSLILSIHKRIQADKVREQDLWERIEHDKKRCGRSQNFVVLTRLGKHRVAPVKRNQFRRAWQETVERLNI
jgi:3-dehydroquinate synthase